MVKIIIGAVMIVGGLTHTMVLRGTQSSTGLVVFGVVLVLWGIARIAMNRNS